jgi:phage terminase large subunit GpA-like protein
LTSWEKESGKRNEPFDLLNYNYAVLEILHPNWDVLEQKIERGVDYTQPMKSKTAVRKNQKGIEV